jgi:hypothetical protein
LETPMLAAPPERAGPAALGCSALPRGHGGAIPGEAHGPAAP